MFCEPPKQILLVIVRETRETIDLFTDMVGITISIVSDSYHGKLRWQTSVYLPPEHPIIAIQTMEFKMATILVKRSIA